MYPEIVSPVYTLLVKGGSLMQTSTNSNTNPNPHNEDPMSNYATTIENIEVNIKG